MTPLEIARLCHAAGWRGGNLVVAVAVCLGESEGNPRAFNNRGKDLSYGLLQINLYGALGPERRARYGLSSNEDLFDPATNLRVGYDLWVRARHSFTPWGAFTSGGYKKFGRYEKAQQAVAEMVVVARSVKALLKLLAEIDAIAPGRSKSSDGWIGDSAHASRASDHNAEGDGTVDARDFTHDPARGADMNVLSERIRFDRRVKYIIWNRRIWNPSVSLTWRPYSGSNPHDKHMHVSVLDSLQDDDSDWLEQEDILPALTEEQQLKLYSNASSARNAAHYVKNLHPDTILARVLGDIVARLDRIEAALVPSPEGGDA